MKTLLLIVTLLVGCGRALPQVTLEPPAQDDRAAIRAVLETWNARDDLPEITSERAEEMLRTTLVTDASVETFHSRCRVCAPSRVDPDCDITWGTANVRLRAAACSVSDNRCSGPFCGLFTEPARLIVIAPGYDAATRRRLIIHEAVHWAGMFAGSHMDGGHSDLRRWCDGTCGPGNVEGDARTWEVQ